MLQAMLAESDIDMHADDRELDEAEIDTGKDIYTPIQEMASWKGFKESQLEDDQRIRDFQKTMSITRKVNKFVTRQSSKFNRAKKSSNDACDMADRENVGVPDIEETDNESLMGSQVDGSVLDVLEEGFKTDLLKLRKMKYPVFTDNQIEAIKQGVRDEMDGIDQPELDFEAKYYSEQRERISHMDAIESADAINKMAIDSVTTHEGNIY